MNKSCYRLWLLSSGMITFLVLIASFYFEYVRQLNPCPLCLMQRLCVMLMLFLVILNVFLTRSTRRVGMTWVGVAKKILTAQFLIAAAGLFFAVRQLWLQSLPAEEVPICLPGLGIMIHYLPWQDVARVLLFGAGDCAEVSWTFLGLSMPAWTAIYFSTMLGLVGYMKVKFTWNNDSICLT